MYEWWVDDEGTCNEAFRRNAFHRRSWLGQLRIVRFVKQLQSIAFCKTRTDIGTLSRSRVSSLNCFTGFSSSSKIFCFGGSATTGGVSGFAMGGGCEVVYVACG